MKGNKTASERLNAKALDQMFVNMVEQGYECPPFIRIQRHIGNGEIRIRTRSGQSGRTDCGTGEDFGHFSINQNPLVSHYPNAR
jgi:hypothetical protein